jgi:uncharacterized protein YjbJ (UPF0337 family)
MSTATESTFKGKFDEVAGKVKQTFGEATHNDSVANDGAAQQVKGHAEEAWGTVKGAATDSVHQVEADHAQAQAQHEAENEHKAHDIRESITSTAQNVKEKIQDTFKK